MEDFELGGLIVLSELDRDNELEVGMNVDVEFLSIEDIESLITHLNKVLENHGKKNS